MKPNRRVHSCQRGVVAPMVAVIMLGLVALLGLVVDGGVLVSARRELQMLADGASRAGAMAIDIDVLRRTGRVQLDPDDANRNARAYLQAAGFDGTMQVSSGGYTTTVDLAQNRDTVILGVLGIRRVQVIAHAIARPRAGIERPE